MRVSVKTDYAVRAMAQLAADADDGPVPAARLAAGQDIPVKFLHGVLAELRRARLVRSTRGAEGGFTLGRPATEITLADVIRAIDGPLVDVHDERLSALTYPGPAAALREVWMAARTSLRDVFERVSVADLAGGRLPDEVVDLAERYRATARES